MLWRPLSMAICGIIAMTSQIWGVVLMMGAIGLVLGAMSLRVEHRNLKRERSNAC